MPPRRSDLIIARDLANLTTLEDSPQGPQQGIDLRQRSRKLALEGAAAVAIQQGIADGAEHEPQGEPSEAEDADVVDDVDAVQDGAKRDVQRLPVQEPSATPQRKKRRLAGQSPPKAAWSPDYEFHFAEQHLDENEKAHELWRSHQEQPRSAQARMVQTRKAPYPPRNAATEFLDMTKGAATYPLGSRHPQHAATRSHNAIKDSVEEDPLGNWDKFLLSSQMCSGQEDKVLMGFVKAFFMSTGFHKPRNLVGITESILEKMIKAVESGSQKGYIPPDGINLRLLTCLYQVVILATDLAKQRGSTSNSRGDQDGGNCTGKPLELSNNSINALKMMGTGAMAHTVLNTVNAVKVTPKMIPAFLRMASLGNDIDSLPMEFTPSTDVISMLISEGNAAIADNRQAFTYFLLTDDAFQPQWLPPEAIGGIVHFIKEDLILATDNQKKDALTMINGLSKSIDKTRFFRSRDHWMLAWARILPILLASGQWSLVAWVVHLDHICKLYELNKNGSDYLITFYEDRLRKQFHDRCARGDTVDLVAECGVTNVNVMDACKTKLYSVLQSAGLQNKAAHRHYNEMSDPADSGAARQQTIWGAESKKLQLQFNAMKQREDSYASKVQALQHSQPNYSAGKFTKSWNSSNKSSGKGKGKHTPQRPPQRSSEEHAFSSQVHSELKPYRSSNPGWQPPAKGKQKGKGNGNNKKWKARSSW